MAREWLASQNAQKIRALMESGEGYADLYRTFVGGPSGQRGDLLVGRIRYLVFGADVFSVIDMSTGKRVGTARLTPYGEWSMTAEHPYDGALSWAGYASSLSVGVDVLVNGEHAALGRHDSRRISSGSIRKGPERPPIRKAA